MRSAWWPPDENADPSPLAALELRIPESGAFGAHGVGELELRTIPNVGLDLLPLIALLNSFARSADGENTGQSFYVGEGLLQLGDQLILTVFLVFATIDVAAVDDHALDDGMIQKIVGNDFERNP